MFDDRVIAHAGVCRFSPEQVDRLRRAHVAMAYAELVAERAGGVPSVSEIVGRANVSRKTLYRLFAGKDAVGACAAQLAFDQALAYVRAACREQEKGPPRVRAAAGAFVAHAREHPDRARLYVAEPVLRALPALERAIASGGEEPTSEGAGGTGAERQATPKGDDPVEALVIAAMHEDRAALTVLTGVAPVADLASVALTGGVRAVLEHTGDLVPRGRLSPQAERTISYLARHPRATVGEIQAALGHRHRSQTSRLLRRLAEQRLVATAPSPVQHAPATGWVVVAEIDT